MTTGAESGVHKPQFILEPSMGETTIAALQGLETTIFRDPVVIQHALAIQAEREAGAAEAAAHGTAGPATADGPALAAKVAYEDEVKLATSREVGLEFDDVTEERITSSAAMQLLQKRRKDNQRNETTSRQLAAEVRRARLELFVAMALTYQEATTAQIVPMPEPRMSSRRGHSRPKSA